MCITYRMYFKRIAITLTGMFLAACMYAQTDSKFFLAYDAGFMTTLDNRAYELTDLDNSQTVFAAGLGGGVGAGLRIGNSSHRLMAGVSALFPFGGEIKARPLIWYQLNTNLGNSQLQVLGGSFSRGKVGGYYSQLLFSDLNIINDNSFEGFQFSLKATDFYYEFGIDRKGQKRSSSPMTREQITFYSAGHHYPIHGQPLKLGYAGYVHFLGNSFEMKADDAVNDVIFYPYAEYDFGSRVNVQRALARLGYYQSFQSDRSEGNRLLAPAKGQVYLELRNWNVGFINDFLFGGDLMPFYDKLGSDYFGDPLMARNAGGKKFALYDKVSVYYEPKLLDKLSLRFQVNCHFNGGFAGWQQIVELKYKFGN